MKNCISPTWLSSFQLWSRSISPFALTSFFGGLRLPLAIMYFPLTTMVILSQSLAFVHATVSVTCAAPWVSTAVKIVDALPSSEGIIYCSSLLSKYKTTTGRKSSSPSTSSNKRRLPLKLTLLSLVTTQKCSGTTTSTSTIGVKATVSSVSSRIRVGTRRIAIEKTAGGYSCGYVNQYLHHDRLYHYNDDNKSES